MEQLKLNNKSEQKFIWITTFIFFSLSLFGILYHGIWLDEAHSFLIVRDSQSFSELLANTQLEGHPLLWYLLLSLLKGIHFSVFSMQLMHIFIATLNIYLLLHFAPFDKLKKVLFSFSYFFFYEYNIISRNYAICLLCVTVFCILLSQKKKNYVIISLILALLANSHFIGLLLSISLALATIIFYLSNDKEYKSHYSIQIILFSFILMSAFTICIAQVMPPGGSIFVKPEASSFLAAKRWGVFTIITKGLFQFPQLGEKFWNTNLFTQNKVIGAILSIITILALIKSFINKPLSLFIILSSFISISLFFFSLVKSYYTVRHWGFIFIAYYAAMWLSLSLDQEKVKYNFKIYKILPDQDNAKIRETLLYTSLIIQVAASIYLYYMDYKKPFSSALAVSDYIKDNKFQNDLVIVSKFSSGPAVSAYLNKKLYYPEYHNLGSFGVWNTNPIFLSRDQLIHDLNTLSNKKYKRAILALDKNIINPLKEKSNEIALENTILRIKYPKGFKKSFGEFENYDLFLVEFKQNN